MLGPRNKTGEGAVVHLYIQVIHVSADEMKVPDPKSDPMPSAQALCTMLQGTPPHYGRLDEGKRKLRPSNKHDADGWDEVSPHSTPLGDVPPCIRCR